MKIIQSLSTLNFLFPERFRTFWTYPIEIGDLRFTALSLLLGILLLTALLIGVGAVKSLLSRRVLPRIGLAQGAAAAVSTLVGYLILFIGLLIILPVMVPGFNLNTLSVVLGAVSFGIGFGLRNVADNFFSGLIVLIERPIKVGDRIEVSGTYGTVLSIGARSTIVHTNDNVDIIVPNSLFISEQVTNLSHLDRNVRFKIPVGVHYESDARLVEKALLEAADQCPDVLKNPAPGVRFIAFGDSSLVFELRVWSNTLCDRPQALISQVNFAIWDKFKECGISIPYPQRDLYLKEVPDNWRANPAGNA